MAGEEGFNHEMLRVGGRFKLLLHFDKQTKGGVAGGTGTPFKQPAKMQISSSPSEFFSSQFLYSSSPVNISFYLPGYCFVAHFYEHLRTRMLSVMLLVNLSRRFVGNANDWNQYSIPLLGRFMATSRLGGTREEEVQ